VLRQLSAPSSNVAVGAVIALLILVLEIPAFIGLGYFFFRFLGAFAKFRKATISLAVSARPLEWSNSSTTGRILMKFDI
jgi:hypothetical protein